MLACIKCCTLSYERTATTASSKMFFDRNYAGFQPDQTGLEFPTAALSR